MSQTTGIENRSVPLVARSDIEVQRIYFRGEAYHVAKDPLSLSYFHLQPAQYAAWKLLDGEISYDGLRTKILDEFPALSIKANDIQQLVADLHAKGLTASLRCGQSYRLRLRKQKRHREKVVQLLTSPFFMRFPPWRPDALVKLMSPLMRWLFRPAGIAFVTVVVLASWLEALLRWDDLKGSLPSLQAFFGWPNLMWLWVMIGGTKLFHELGHAIACEHVGRRCHGIGAALLVFSPTLYCDATDSWMCTNKWHRIMVAAAGMYVELFLGALALFIWSHTHPGLIHTISLNAAAISTVSTVIFNANPLIRFDGYYILSDLIEIPSLQQKSSQLLYRFLAWSVGYSTPRSPLDPKSGHVWFVGYAIASLVYRWFIMAAIMWTIYAMVRPYRIESLGGLWVGVVVMMTGFGVFRSAKSVLGSKKEGEFSRKRLLVSSMAISSFLLVAGVAPFTLWHTASVVIEHREQAVLYTTTGGEFKQLDSRIGQPIEREHQVMVLGNSEVEDEVRDLKHRIALVRSEAKSLRIKNSHAAFVLKQSEQERLERRLRELLPLQSELVITSPIDGELIAGGYVPPTQNSKNAMAKWSRWLLDEQNIGAFVAPGSVVARVVSPDEYVAIIYVEQNSVEDFRVGQHVAVCLDAMPYRLLNGEVESISSDKSQFVPGPIGQRLGGRISTRTLPDGREEVEQAIYRLEVSLPGDHHILPGMRGRARVVLQRRTLASWAMRSFRSTFYFRF